LFLSKAEKSVAAATETNAGNVTPGDQQVESGSMSTPTPPVDGGAKHDDDDDLETEMASGSEEELILSELGGESPSPPVHDEFTQHTTALRQWRVQPTDPTHTLSQEGPKSLTCGRIQKNGKQVLLLIF